MRKFADQELLKQEKMINAAMTCFGRNGYRKTSIQDVADEAKISKALLFHYFGSKKAMYLYVVDYANKTSSDLILSNQNMLSRDLFELMRQIQESKLKMYVQHPSLFRFLESVFFETEPEIINEVKSRQQNHYAQQIKTLMADIDCSGFREEVTLQDAMNLITWVTEGFVKSIQHQDPLLNEANIEKFDFYFSLVKRAILKED